MYFACFTVDFWQAQSKLLRGNKVNGVFFWLRGRAATAAAAALTRKSPAAPTPADQVGRRPGHDQTNHHQLPAAAHSVYLPSLTLRALISTSCFSPFGPFCPFGPFLTQPAANLIGEQRSHISQNCHVSKR